MKKVIISFSCGVIIALSAVAYAADSIQTVLFPVQAFFNGVPKTVEQETPILNYNGYTYVPARFMAENMNALVAYNPDNKSVSFTYTNSTSPVLSKVSSQKQDGDFKLTLYSEKDDYASTEPLNIWSTLDYVGEDTNIAHRSTLFQYYMKDEAGNVRMEAKFDHYIVNTMRKNSVFKEDFSPAFIRYFNYKRSEIKNFEEFLNTMPQSDHLQSGTYTIGVLVTFKKDGTEEKDTTLFTEMPLAIK